MTSTDLCLTSGKYADIPLSELIEKDSKFCKNLMKRYENAMKLKDVAEYLRTKEDEIEELAAEQKLKESEDKEPPKNFDENDIALVVENLDEGTVNSRKYKARFKKLYEAIEKELDK
jgi:NACalpha-BTF3-like transcription factor